MAIRHRFLEILVTLFVLGLWAYLSFWINAFSSRNGLWDLGASGWFVILLLPAAIFFYYLHTGLVERPVNRPRLWLAGLILLGMIGLVTAGSFAAAKEREAHELGLCQSHARQLALALLIYAEADYDNYLPPVEHWTEAIKDYLKDPKALKCPADPSPGGSSYAFNANLSGKNLKQLPNLYDTPLIYEIPRNGSNPRGNPEDGSSGGRHGKIFVIAFADGHTTTDYADDTLKLGAKP